MADTRIMIVAQMFINPEQVKEALPILKYLEQETNKEKGCLRYVLSVPNKKETSGEFLFFEEWDCQENLAAHSQTKHFTETFQQLGPLLSKAPEINYFNRPKL